MTTSYGPNRDMNVVLLEGVSETAVELFRNADLVNITRIPKALDGPDLLRAVADAHVLGIRSRTQLTEEVFAAAEQLLVVGCFCIGTNQVDLGAAAHRGVPVFNAPFSNTRSVAELVIGEIVMLLRGIPGRSAAAHQGVWDKSSANSWEIRGKTLGIVGYGNIGSQLSVLAEAFGMRVIYFDVLDKLPHGNARAAKSLASLLEQSDVVSLHVPETADTAMMIGEAELAMMRKSAIIINNSRGSVLDIAALAACLRAGRLLGAAVDVFPVEPAATGERFNSPLQGLPNVILTPHVGGSTAEAQSRIGVEVARKLIDYSDTGATLGAVNFPQVQLPARSTGIRYMHVHRNQPGMLGRINDIFASRGLNIAAEFLQTDGDIGYVVVEADSSAIASKDILENLRRLDGTIRARLLYERA
jgi:D-3-phosphoglycerate dehydrogenase